MNNKIILGYWNNRCLVQDLKLILAYNNVNYDNKIYNIGNAPDYDKSEWLNEKYNLGLDYPNLPYLIDDKIKLTQHKSIIIYLGKKYNLFSNDENFINMTLEVFHDWYIQFTNLTYSSYLDFNKDKDYYIKNNLIFFFKIFENKLENKEFLLDKLTILDFRLFELLYQHINLDINVFNLFENNIKNFLKNFIKLKNIDKFLLESDKIIIHNKYSQLNYSIPYSKIKNIINNL